MYIEVQPEAQQFYLKIIVEQTALVNVAACGTAESIGRPERNSAGSAALRS
jgi:hypothetical protein